MHISALYTYPIKSCAGLSHEEIELDSRGPLWDRCWMLVDSEGKFMTQREFPGMALIQPAFKGDTMSLTAPGMPEACIPLQQEHVEHRDVQIWDDRCQAWDEGDDLARWFSDYLKTNVRLVRFAEDFYRTVNPKYARRPAETSFSDGFPLLILSETSLAELNRRLVERDKEALPMRRFRPNMVIADSDAFAEDTWRTIRAGEVLIDVVKPCARCFITTVDPATGTVPDAAEPLATLNTFRKQNGKVMFAQNAIHHAPGTLHIGNPLEVLESVSEGESWTTTI